MCKLNVGFLFIFCALTSAPAMAATSRAAGYLAPNTYANMYPYMNNSMRTNLNSGASPSRDNAQINVLTRTYQMPGTNTRRVVARPVAARSATSGTARRTTSATNTTRRVVSRPVAARTGSSNTARAGTTSVARAGTTQTTNRGVRARSVRSNTSATNRSTVVGQDTNATRVSSSRCLADYAKCMNGYCQREDTAYNRCYCSAKLSQIDATYQSDINNLITQLLTKQDENQWTQEEMNEYWMDTIGKYTGDNSWVRLENALDIDWAGTESRVRGQQAFTSAHEYCSQHLRGCFYMAGNMRDAYRSEINRDCAAYEASLQEIKSAAESILESY